MRRGLACCRRDAAAALHVWQLTGSARARNEAA